MRILLTVMLSISLAVTVQAGETANPVLPARCDSEKYHQFDFWIGDWDVTADGRLAGTNSVHPILDGCVLVEKWQGAGVGAISGSSFNIYDRANDRWHQTWVDSSGTLLELNGEWRNGSMVLQGQRPSPDGKGTTMHRITWTPNADGSVRQLWEASADGQSWTILFDGLYKKRSENDATR